MKSSLYGTRLMLPPILSRLNLMCINFEKILTISISFDYYHVILRIMIVCFQKLTKLLVPSMASVNHMGVLEISCFTLMFYDIHYS
jgi:hypothetical protein